MFECTITFLSNLMIKEIIVFSTKDGMYITMHLQLYQGLVYPHVNGCQEDKNGTVIFIIFNSIGSSLFEFGSNRKKIHCKKECYDTI